MNKLAGYDRDAFSLYVHIPFCEKKCFYCSFVIAVGQQHRVDEYLKCLSAEARMHPRSDVQTIFIGGGTPSFLNNDQIDRLFEIIHTHFNVSPDAEITLEANPESLDLSKAKLLKKLGVNRMSVGVQSLSDARLQYLGRNHRKEGAIRSYHTLREAGFDNISLDLMFCFPDQTETELLSDLEAITALQSEHLSLYTLTVEENSRFYTNKLKLSGEDVQASYYQTVCDHLRDKGFLQYEVSNFSKSGRESLHNIHYWQGGNYVGLGVGAHSHKDGERWWNKSKFMEYIQAIQKKESSREGQEHLSVQERLIETLLFGLRMNTGVNLTAFKERYQADLPLAVFEKINAFVGEGLLVENNGIVCVTDRGRCVLDEISARLI